MGWRRAPFASRNQTPTPNGHAGIHTQSESMRSSICISPSMYKPARHRGSTRRKTSVAAPLARGTRRSVPLSHFLKNLSRSLTEKRVFRSVKLLRAVAPHRAAMRTRCPPSRLELPSMRCRRGTAAGSHVAGSASLPDQDNLTLYCCKTLRGEAGLAPPKNLLPRPQGLFSTGEVHV